MEHNSFNVYKDLVIHIKCFLEAFINTGFDFDNDIDEFSGNVGAEIHFPMFMYLEPQ
jgi:hypothetical protein